jgi:hypothetical protein
MKWLKPVAILSVAFLTIGAKAPPPDYERVVDVATGNMVSGTINGHPVKLRVDLDAPDWIMLNPEVATRVGLNGSMLKGSFRMHGEKIKIDSSVTRVQIRPYNKRRRVFWADRKVFPDPVDGIISPAHLPENRVTLRYHPPVPGERKIELDIDPSRFRGLRHKVEVGGETVWVSFSPPAPRSIATAATGAHLATTNDGHWTGEPERIKVELGIGRPGRPMEIRKPLDMNGLANSGFLVRTADYRGKFQLPTDPPDPDVDPDEVVVTAQKNSGAARLWLTLGKDTLGGCSSITYDKRRNMLTLYCL